MSCSTKRIQPKNGIYLTNADFETWHDYYGKLLESRSSCGSCSGCDVSTDKSVKNVTFVVTESCDLNCTYCYEQHKTKRRMSRETARQAVDFLFDEQKVNGYYDTNVSKGLILEFIGGEPLLEIDLINYVVEYFKFRAFELDHVWALNYMISITSNGTHYLDEKVQAFLKRNEGRVSVSITIDGNKELHDSCRVFYDGRGSYDVVEKSVKHMIQHSSKPQTKITLAPANIHHLSKAIKDVWNLGIIVAYSNCVFEEGWEMEHAVTFYNELKILADYLLEDGNYGKFYTTLFDDTIGKELLDTRNWCGGNGQMLAIDPEGKCFPCIRFMKYSLSTPGREEQPVGDIYNGLDSKDENEWLKRLNKIDMISQSPEKCLNCTVPSGCALCTGYHYDKFGDPNVRATYICDTHKARVLANAYYWNKLYRMHGISHRFELNVPKEWALQIMSEDEYNMILELSKGGD